MQLAGSYIEPVIMEWHCLKAQCEKIDERISHTSLIKYWIYIMATVHTVSERVRD
jgi:hypothetical protein